MSDWKTEIEEALNDFIQVAKLARAPLRPDDLQVEFLEAPHKPPSRLPPGKMAVYGFEFEERWLKIGRAGPNSQARYVSQHYNPQSVGSNLAKSLLEDSEIASRPDFTPNDPGEWIRSRTNRVNILLDKDHGTLLLALLEAFLHVRLRPRYER